MKKKEQYVELKINKNEKVYDDRVFTWIIRNQFCKIIIRSLHSNVFFYIHISMRMNYSYDLHYINCCRPPPPPPAFFVFVYEELL